MDKATKSMMIFLLCLLLFFALKLYFKSGPGLGANSPAAILQRFGIVDGFEPERDPYDEYYEGLEGMDEGGFEYEDPLQELHDEINDELRYGGEWDE